MGSHHLAPDDDQKPTPGGSGITQADVRRSEELRRRELEARDPRPFPHSLSNTKVSENQESAQDPSTIVLQGGYVVPYYGMPGALEAAEERMREVGRDSLEEFVTVANRPDGPDRLEGVARRIEMRASKLREAWEKMMILASDAHFLEPFNSRYTNRPAILVLEPLKALRGFPGIYVEIAEKLDDLYAAADGNPDIEAVQTIVADRLNAQAVIQSAAKIDIEMRLHALRLVLNASDESMQGEVQWLEHLDGRVYVWKGEPVVGTNPPEGSEPGVERTPDGLELTYRAFADLVVKRYYEVGSSSWEKAHDEEDEAQTRYGGSPFKDASSFVRSKSLRAAKSDYEPGA